MATKKAVAAKEENNIIVMDDFLADSGSGMDDMPLDRLSVPMIKTTAMGDIIHSITGDEYDGKKGLKARLCHHKELWIWWLDRQEGGDAGGSSRPKTTFLNKADCPPHVRDPKDNIEYVYINGEKQDSYIQNTAQTYWILYPEDAGDEQEYEDYTPRVMLPLKNTGWKAYTKNIVTPLLLHNKVNKIPTGHAEQPFFIPPMWWYLFNISVVANSKEINNSKVEWLNFEFTIEDKPFIPEKFNPQSKDTWKGIDLDTYNECKEFKEFMVQKLALDEETRLLDPSLNGSEWSTDVSILAKTPQLEDKTPY